MEDVLPSQTQRSVMKSLLCAFVAVLLAVPAFGADAPPDVRPLATKVNFDYEKGGTAPKPVEIKSAKELAKSELFADDDSRDAINKQVDFDKEKLVVFVWKASGG